MGNFHSTDMNSTYHSLSTNMQGENRWSSFDYYPFKRGNNRVVYKGVSYKSKIDRVFKNTERNESFSTYDESNGNYWTKKKCVVKSIKTTDFDLNYVRNEGCYWFKKSWMTGSDYAIMFEKEFQEVNETPKIVFAKSYLSKVDNMSSPWNFICNMFRSRKQRVFESYYVLIEDRIHGKFETIIDENGEVDNSNYHTKVLNTFLHFTYHKSDEKLVICDFQGVMSSNGTFYLTFPTIHSVDESFGPRDKGREGIRRVFSNHFCGELCRKWTKPDK